MTWKRNQYKLYSLTLWQTQTHKILHLFIYLKMLYNLLLLPLIIANSGLLIWVRGLAEETLIIRSLYKAPAFCRVSLGWSAGPSEQADGFWFGRTLFAAGRPGAEQWTLPTLLLIRVNNSNDTSPISCCPVLLQVMVDALATTNSDFYSNDLSWFTQQKRSFPGSFLFCCR